jgi:hypothetical protein
VGYPVVAKPDVGVGAAATLPLRDAAHLERFHASRPPVDYLLEEYIPGHIVTYDGITDHDGQVLFSTSHYFPTLFMDVVNADDHLSFYSLRRVDPDVEEAGRRVVAAFDTRARFFHFEFFRLLDDRPGLGRAGDLVALEVNMRPPGGHMTEMINYANDVDVFRMWAEMIVHNHVTWTIERKYHCGYASRKYRKSYRHTHDEIMARHGDKVVLYREVEAVLARVMGNCIYLFRSPSLDEIREITAFIQAERAE